MKQCVHCKEYKPIDDFAFSNRAKGIRQKHCRTCMSKFNKASYAKKSDKDKKRIYENRSKRREKARQFVWDYLTTHPCVDCGEVDPQVLEFDHVRGKKFESISVLASGRYSIDRIEKEIRKCVVRCANCHRKKTFKERGWFRG